MTQRIRAQVPQLGRLRTNGRSCGIQPAGLVAAPTEIATAPPRRAPPPPTAPPPYPPPGRRAAVAPPWPPPAAIGGAARRSPGPPAYIEPGARRSVTWGELHRLVQDAAAGLVTLGL